MELIDNMLQLFAALLGAGLTRFIYRKSRQQPYFLLLCFYGCFALGSLYWALYLLLFSTTPQVFYVSEVGWISSLIFLLILQAVLAEKIEHGFHSRIAWLSPVIGVPLLIFYCTYGDILSNLIWCGMMIFLSFGALRGLFMPSSRQMQRKTCAIFTLACCAMCSQNTCSGQQAAFGPTSHRQAPPSGVTCC